MWLLTAAAAATVYLVRRFARRNRASRRAYPSDTDGVSREQ